MIKTEVLPYRSKEETMNAKKKSSTAYLTKLAVMVAIILVMSFTPLGYLKTPGLSITLLTVPVAVAAAMLGPVGGAVAGLTFGLTSFYQAMTSGGFATMLMAISPFYTFITCVVTRVLEGWLSGLIFKALYTHEKSRKISYYVAGLATPILNTILFMGSLCLFFYNTDAIQQIVVKLGVSNPLAFVFAFVGAQGAIEAGICFVLASAIIRALYAAMKHNAAKKKKQTAQANAAA
jgi:uncharacterized membrane protein